MKKLSSYINVYNTCLVLIERSGFIISYEKNKDIWHAQRGDFFLTADNPIELLGLAKVCENAADLSKDEYWWMIDSPDLLTKFCP